MALASSKICIIAVNYAPEVTGCAPYTADLAEHLAKLGHQIQVITALPHYPQWEIPAEYKAKERRIENLNGVEVFRCGILVPKKMSAIARVVFEASFLVTAWWRSRKVKADLVLAVSPALADIVVGARIAKRLNIPYGVLVQDLMTAATTQSNISGGSKVAGLASAIESRYLKQATSVAAITESFSDSIRALGVDPKRVTVSANYSVKNIERMSRKQAREQLGWPVDTFVLAHTGNMGLKQDLGNLIEAIKLVDSSNAKLLLVGDGSQRDELVAQAVGASNVEFMGLVSDADYSALLSASNVLLINEAPTITDMSLPSKLTAYEASGQKILGAVVPGGNTSKALAKMANATQVPAGNPQLLASEIAKLIIENVEFTAELDAKVSSIDNNAMRENRGNWALGLLQS